jgi:hypothetical protein
MEKWMPALLVGAVLYLVLRGSPGGAAPAAPAWPGFTQTPNGDPAIPGVNVPDPWSGNTGNLLPPNPSTGYGFGAYSQ